MMKTRREATQKNAKPAAAGTAAASRAPAKHQFIGTEKAKKTSGPSLYKGNVGPAGNPYYVKGPATNGGPN